MIGIFATLRVEDGRTEACERVFCRMADAVRRNEHGNPVFQLTSHRTEPATYKALDLYRDDEPLGPYRAAGHAKAFGAQFGLTLAGRREVEYFDARV